MDIITEIKPEQDSDEFDETVLMNIVITDFYFSVLKPGSKRRVRSSYSNPIVLKNIVNCIEKFVIPDDKLIIKKNNYSPISVIRRTKLQHKDYSSSITCLFKYMLGARSFIDLDNYKSYAIQYFKFMNRFFKFAKLLSFELNDEGIKLEKYTSKVNEYISEFNIIAYPEAQASFSKEHAGIVRILGNLTFKGKLLPQTAKSVLKNFRISTEIVQQQEDDPTLISSTPTSALGKIYATRRRTPSRFSTFDTRKMRYMQLTKGSREFIQKFILDGDLPISEKTKSALRLEICLAQLQNE
jgi:hypothetical protein